MTKRAAAANLILCLWACAVIGAGQESTPIASPVLPDRFAEVVLDVEGMI